MFEDVKRILNTEKDRYVYHQEWSKENVCRLTEILNDFENYNKNSLESLYYGYREPARELTVDGLLSCLERHKNWVEFDQGRIDEIDMALSILQKYEGDDNVSC